MYADSTTSTTISSVSLIDTSTVRITLVDVPTGSDKRIKYAVGTGVSSTGGPTTGPRGNLRDSDTTLSQYDLDSSGQLDPLYNWSVHFDEPVSPDVAPLISSVSASTTHNSALITWNTNEASTSQVEFGSTISYGSMSTLQTTPTTSHSILLENLTPDTTYHYRVLSVDSIGNIASSADITFMTDSPPDVVHPVLSETTPIFTITADTTPNYSFTSDEAGTITY